MLHDLAQHSLVQHSSSKRLGAPPPLSSQDAQIAGRNNAEYVWLSGCALRVAAGTADGVCPLVWMPRVTRDHCTLHVLELQRDIV